MARRIGTLLGIVALAALSGCARFPELDAANAARGEPSTYPRLAPIAPLLAPLAEPADATEESAAELEARAEALRRRAEELRDRPL